MTENLVYVQTLQTPAIKTLFETMKNIIEDTNIEFSKDGMRVIEMNKGKSMMVYLKLEGSKFERFEFNNSEAIVLAGVNVENFYSILKTMHTHDILTMSVNRKHPNILCLKFENQEKKMITNYKFPLKDINQKLFDIPSCEFDALVTMSASDFQKLCRDIDNLGGQHIEIRAIHRQLMLKSDCTIGERETILNESDKACGVHFINDSGNNIVQGKFLVKHLTSMTKCTTLCNTMELYLKNNYPMIIQYQVPSLGSIKFALSPVVESFN
jgi:proliferating cell nuclear antigen